MTQVTIDGNTYSDDGTSAKDMLNGGHRTHFFPLVQDVVDVAVQVAADAAAADADAAAAAAVATAMRGTSTTSLTVGTGTKSLTTQTAKQFSVGNYLTVARTSAPTTLMHGVVTAYNTGTGALDVDVSTSAGSGTHTDWTIAISGAKGNTGATGNGNIPYLSVTGTTTITAGDRAKLVDCTNASYTVSFSAAATLGADWACTIRNSGTGTITLDPNGAELIDGSATRSLFTGQTVAVTCDGTDLRTYFHGMNRLIRLPILQANAGWTPAAAMENITAGPYATGIAAAATSYAYGSSLYVITPSTGTDAASSADGITWTLRTMPSSANWVAGSDGTAFLAVASGGTATATSAAGTTWTAATALPGSIGTVFQPIMVGGLWIVADTTTTYYTSADGVAWATRTFPAGPVGTFGLRLVGSTAWIKTGATQAYTSTDAINWTSRTLPANYTAVGAQTDGSLVGYIANTICDTTTDGITWSASSVPVLGNQTQPWSVLNGMKILSTDNNVGLYTYDTAWVRRTDPMLLTVNASTQTSRYACSSRGVMNNRVIASVATGYVGMTASAPTGLFAS